MIRKPVVRLFSLAASLWLPPVLIAQSAGESQHHAHAFAHVVIGPQITAPVSGRLLIFARKAEAAAADKNSGSEDGKKKVDISEFHPTDTSVAAQEIHDLAPGSAVEIDLDRVAFPAAFSNMPRGDYELQAVLDLDHNYNYGGRDAEDWESPVFEARG
ncbi:MAG TPA: hypothetical protein VF126_04980, partial [Acidobacteriaceae bacterium]